MTNSQSSSPDPTPSPESVTGTPIRLTFGDTTLTARLTNDATGLDLLSQLPLTLTFRDFNGVEKIADLPRRLLHRHTDARLRQTRAGSPEP
jgi:hypothetical protein